MTCSIWTPADCRIEIFWQAWWAGPIQIVSTDYSSYAIVYSIGEAANINLMEAVWLLSSDPLEEGTAEYTAFYNQMESIVEARLPKFDMRHLSPVSHNADCQYEL